MSDNSNERGINILRANKTIYIEESWIQGSDYGLAIGISGGAAIEVTQMCDLESTTLSLLGEKANSLKSSQELFIKKVGIIFDGKAHERATKSILKTISTRFKL